MEASYLIVTLVSTGFMILAGMVLLLFFMDHRWRKAIEELRKEQSSQPIWGLMQQQMDQLRGQMKEGLDKNVSQLIDSQNIINKNLSDIMDRVNRSLLSSSVDINRRLDNAAKVIGEVQRNIGELSTASKQIFEVGKNIATLQEILQPPKLRGGIGEQFLGELLAQVLPPKFFTLQYPFSSGERVDAVIKLGEKLVPIDSKFPLDNFRRIIECKTEEERRANQKAFLRDVKKHIDDIAGKYIVPNEGTYDFALLYIPAENVYYETITKDESAGEERSILNYALSKRVIPVSPNSFYAYLQVIVLGLKGLQIEENAREIQMRLVSLANELKTFQKDFQVVGTHLTNALNRFEEARRRLDRFSLKFEQAESQPSLPLIEKEIESDKP